MRKLNRRHATTIAAMAIALVVTGAVSGLSLPAIAGTKAPIDWDKDKKVLKARKLIETNNIEEAIKILDEQLAKHPESAVLHSDLGKCYKKRGKLSLARSEFKRATEVDGNYAEAWYELGAMYESDKEWQLAINCYERYLSQNPYADRKDSVKDRLNFCKAKL